MTTPVWASKCWINGLSDWRKVVGRVDSLPNHTDLFKLFLNQCKLSFNIERSLTVIPLWAVRVVYLPHFFRPCAVYIVWST